MPTRSLSLSADTAERFTQLQDQRHQATGEAVRFDAMLRSMLDAPFFSREGIALAVQRGPATTRSANLDDGRLAKLDRMAETLAPLISKGKPNRSRLVAVLCASVWLRDYHPPVRDKAAESANLARLYAESKDPARRLEWATKQAQEAIAADEARRAAKRTAPTKPRTGPRSADPK